MKDIFSTIGSEDYLADIGFSLPREGAMLPDDGQVDFENSMARLHAEYNCFSRGEQIVPRIVDGLGLACTVGVDGA